MNIDREVFGARSWFPLRSVGALKQFKLVRPGWDIRAASYLGEKRRSYESGPDRNVFLKAEERADRRLKGLVKEEDVAGKLASDRKEVMYFNGLYYLYWELRFAEGSRELARWLPAAAIAAVAVWYLYF